MNWDLGSLKEEIRVCGQLLIPNISIGSVPGSPVTGSSRDYIRNAGDPLLRTFVYIVYVFIWGLF
jgi:hypothetical protein